MILPDKAYSVAQAAEFLGLSPKRVQTMAAGGKLPGAFAHLKADGKTVDAYRIPGRVITAYIAQHAVAA